MQNFLAFIILNFISKSGDPTSMKETQMWVVKEG
jgi:hypothetical protein